MPCVDVADSIVQTARETLQAAMKTVKDTPRWNAQVVYGDTDSMFVLLPGASEETAFRVGNEIAAAVTALNPPPVRLKFEKVCLSSVAK
jgi:DNA polymerase zeta